MEDCLTIEDRPPKSGCKSSTVFNNDFNPHLRLPGSILALDPLWASCKPIVIIPDPPTALRPVGSLMPPPPNGGPPLFTPTPTGNPHWIPPEPGSEVHFDGPARTQPHQPGRTAVKESDPEYNGVWKGDQPRPGDTVEPAPFVDAGQGGKASAGSPRVDVDRDAIPLSNPAGPPDPADPTHPLGEKSRTPNKTKGDTTVTATDRGRKDGGLISSGGESDRNNLLRTRLLCLILLEILISLL